MTNDELRDLLTDAAQGAPRTDLVPGALARANRRHLGAQVGLVGTGALALVLVGSLAGGLLGGATTVGVPAATTSPSVSAPTPSATSPSTPPSPRPDSPLTAVPVGAMLTDADLPWKLTPGADSPVANVPTAWGLQCNLVRPKAIQPLVGRSREWGASGAVKRGIGQVVLGWSDARTALAQLRADTGRCAFIERPKVVTDDGTTYLATTHTFDQLAAIGVRRLGNVTIGISVFGGSGDSATLLADTATKLLDAAEKRAHESEADTASYAQGPSEKRGAQPTAAPSEPVAFPIPADASLRPTDFPWKRMTLLQDFGDTARLTTADGLACNDLDRPDALAPLSGRLWDWVQGSGKVSELSVSQVVTGWTDAARALAELRADEGQCVFTDPYQVLVSDTDRWVVRTHTERDLVIALQRVNNVLVSVTMRVPRGESAAAYATPAERLLAAAVKRAKDAGLAER